MLAEREQGCGVLRVVCVVQWGNIPGDHDSAERRAEEGGPRWGEGAGKQLDRAWTRCSCSGFTGKF